MFCKLKIQKKTNKINEINNNNILNYFNPNDTIIASNIPLLDTDNLENKYIKKEPLIDEENSLINDLYLIYCNFYKLKEKNNEKNFNENKK